MTELALKRTPLYNEHLQLKARMVPFGGWDMPVQYSGIIHEHQAVREAAGLFDVSHMGEFLVSGPKALSYLQHLMTNDIQKIAPGGCQYTLMCYPNGTVVDDLIVSCIHPELYFLVVNAGNIDKDWAWMRSHLPSDGVTLSNVSAAYSLLALQGPKASPILQNYFNISFDDLKYYHFKTIQPQKPFEGEAKENTTWVSRTGYTGEDGFEILLPNALASQAFRDLLKLGEPFGLKPVGLGARDTLRLEACYSLYGHEINDTITGLEAKLGWVIKFDKENFIGKESLFAEKEKGSLRTIAGFEVLDNAIARDGYKIYDLQNQEVGYVTSGTHSPLFKKSLGLALLKKEFAQIESELQVDVRGKLKKIRLVKTPFYKRTSK